MQAHALSITLLELTDVGLAIREVQCALSVEFSFLELARVTAIVSAARTNAGIPLGWVIPSASGFVARTLSKCEGRQGHTNDGNDELERETRKWSGRKK